MGGDGIPAGINDIFLGGIFLAAGETPASPVSPRVFTL